MNRTLLFVLALIAVGCAEGEQSETPSDGSEQVTPAEQSETLSEGSEQVTPSASCSDMGVLSPLEDVRSCAEQGDARVQSILGMAYRIGDEGEFGIDGIPQDDAEAVRWWRLAAEQGHEFAQQDLGNMYEDGEGVPKDYVLAYMWSNLAAAQGNFPAGLRRDRLEEQMTREQIAEAQRLSREWLAAHPPGGN